MKNRNVGLIYFGLDVMSSTLVLVAALVSIIVKDPHYGEWSMCLVLPVLANAPVSLIVVPWLEAITERTEWVLLIFGLSLGCIQNYFLGWMSAWAFKHRKQKAPWGWVLLIIFSMWSAFIGYIFLLSLIASLGPLSELFL